MALSIGNISLQNATVKGLLQITIFYSKHESFLPWMFSHIQYQIYILIPMESDKSHGVYLRVVFITDGL